MIDVESTVYATVASVLKTEIPGIFVSGEYVDVPARFPAVTIVESSNIVYEPVRTTRIENAVQLMYEVNIYTNTVGYKKLDAKNILSVLDAEFEKLNFTRVYSSPVANLEDATIYRQIARYEGVAVREIDPDGDVTYRIYTE